MKPLHEDEHASHGSLRAKVEELTAEVARMREERDAAIASRDSFRKQASEALDQLHGLPHLQGTLTHMRQGMHLAHDKLEEARAQRDALLAVVRRLVGAMNRWGAEGDGVPDASFYADPHYGTAYDDAVAMLESYDAALGDK